MEVIVQNDDITIDDTLKKIDAIDNQIKFKAFGKTLKSIKAKCKGRTTEN